MEAPKMLMEHEPSTSSKELTENVYNPDESERKLLKKCEGLFQKAKKARAAYDYSWVDYYKMFRGKQWKEQRPSYRAQEVFNMVWEAIQSQVPIMLDAKPKFEFLAQEPSDQQFAEMMNEVCTADWQKYNWNFTLAEVAYDSRIYGTGLSSLKFDDEKDVIVYHSVSPFYFFPDPSAENLRTKCSYTNHTEPMDTEKIKRAFPDKAKFISSDVVDFSCEKNLDLSSVKLTSPTSSQLYIDVTGGFDTQKVPETLVKTYYLEDDEVLEEEVKDEESDGPPRIQRRLKYPRGRKVIIANEVLLHNDEIEYEDDSKYPYQRLINYILPRCFWGISEIEPLESPQRTFNKVVSIVLDTLYLMGNPIWIVDTSANIDTQNLSSAPGLIVEKAPNSEVKRESGTGLQPYVLELIDRLRDWFQKGSGNQDVSRGFTSGGVTAASAIEDLQNAAQTRERLKMKNLDAYLQDLGLQYASRVMQFYTAPRVFRLTNKDGTEKYFRMSISKTPEGVTQALVHRFTDANLLNPTSETYQLRGKLDVRVTTGSSLPFSKSQAEKRALSLFDRGIIDAEEVLKSMEYPNWEAILQRMQVKAEQAAQMKAQEEANAAQSQHQNDLQKMQVQHEQSSQQAQIKQQQAPVAA